MSLSYLVQRELEIGRGGDGDFFTGVRGLACDKQANEHQHFCCETANEVYVELVFVN